MMNSVRILAFASLAALAWVTPTAKADEWDKKTILTVSETIQIPTTVLPPGTYTFKLLDSSTDRHIVQVFDKDGRHLITTILAIPNYRLTPTDKSQFSFWEVPAGEPPAMRAWFYPGDNFGQEFAYPKNMSTAIAASAKMTVPTTTATTVEEYKTAPITTVDESGLVANLGTAFPLSAPVLAPAPVVAPTPVPAPVAPVELPRTASSVPLIGLVGLLSLLAFFALRPGRAR